MNTSRACNSEDLSNRCKLEEETDALVSQQTTTYMSINDEGKESETVAEYVKQLQPNTVYGVNVKRGVSSLNVFALFYIAAIMTAVSGYINAQMTFLL